MSLNGRLTSLRLVLARHATTFRPRQPRRGNSLAVDVFCQQQKRGLNEFIYRAPESQDQHHQQRHEEANNTFRLAIKDNIATLPADGPTTCASRILAGHNSPYEATVVAHLKRRGARVVGKTNLDEFGMGGHSVHSAYGPVAQEICLSEAEIHDLVRDAGSRTAAEEGKKSGSEHEKESKTPQLLRLSAGGSSGGSALAVASGAADIALGTDTGGSVRLPAAYCGVVGFKPSYGMLSRYGVVPYANSLDTVGLLARDVTSLRSLVLGQGEGETSDGLWTEHDPRDPTSLSSGARRRCAAERKFYAPTAPLSKTGIGEQEAKRVLQPLTFGIPAEYNIEELEPCIRQAWHDTAIFLREAIGARVVPVSLPSTKHALSAYYIIAPAEASSNLAKYDGVRYGPKQSEIEAQNSKSTNDADTKPPNERVLYSTVRGQNFGPEVQRRILLGSYTLSSEAIDNYFIQAQRIRALVRRDFDRVLRLSNPLLDADAQRFDLAEMDEAVVLEDKLGPPQVDFLLCPTAPTLPPKLDDVLAREKSSPTEAYMNDVFTVPASLAGLPAVSIPHKVKGQPAWRNTMGLQIIGQYWDDARLLAVAEALTALNK
ncbi:amidase signature domain-containing protein [Coniella lustricola]|uniref:Glutamyl-tRNA(Gln) amidotransferase subunit A, mitochondrial n=1 Tax=Coniella lustricola TaxID=2025994 RepID=A0A2T2ZX85_9PEZI|nr:amidase signature domain-containing protein [Coniella lustricola]